MKFVEHRDQTAADLREVCKHLEERAKQIEQGDLSVMDHLLAEEWGLWGQMLMLRCGHREERVQEARASQGEFSGTPGFPAESEADELKRKRDAIQKAGGPTFTREGEDR